MRALFCAIAAGLACLLYAAPAIADPVADAIAAELAQNGVPNVSVSITTPPAATSQDAAAFAADPSSLPPTINPSNVLSPDPTAPQPVVTVRLPGGTATTTPGTVTPPGEPGTFANDAQTAVSEALVMQAVKHASAEGTAIAGVIAYAPPLGQRDISEPVVYAPTPDPAEFPATPTPQTTQTMTTGAIQAQFTLDLPPQYSSASISVADAAGGQRVVTIQYDQAAKAFADDDLSALTDFADAEQAALDDPMRGGNVGQVIIKSRDVDAASPTYGETIYVRATDVTWGEEFEWAAPDIAAFSDRTAGGEGGP